MKPLLLLLLLLPVVGCSPTSQQTEKSPAITDQRELSGYRHRIVRFSNSVSNPFNWGASPKTMKAWGKKIGWEVELPLSPLDGKPGMKQMIYWVSKGEGDYKQRFILQFRWNKLVAINLMAMGKMDEAIQSTLDEEYSVLSPGIWRSVTSGTTARKQTSTEHIGALYSFVDSNQLSQ